MTRKARVIHNLSKYECMTRFLKNIIKQRLEIKGYTRGMLTAHLLEPSELTKPDLERLESVLQLGKKVCVDFKRIFRIGRLPQNQEFADGRITDMLSEVRAVELLHNLGGKDITYLRQKSRTKTVDFMTKIVNDSYAIEVTRLGLPSSDKKKSTPFVAGSIKDKNNETSLEYFMVNGKTKGQNGLTNEDIWENAIGAAIKRKYRQIKEFIQTQNTSMKGIIIISTGRDYFVSKYARRDMFLGKTLERVLKNRWNKLLETKDISTEYLYCVVFILGKGSSKEIVMYPQFSIEG